MPPKTRTAASKAAAAANNNNDVGADATTVAEPIAAAAAVNTTTTPNNTSDNTVAAPVHPATERSQQAAEKLQAAATLVKDLSVVLKDVTLVLKQLQKDIAVLQRENASGRGRRRANNGGAKGGAPKAGGNGVGFTRPALLSQDMCKFLGVPEGTEMARTDVTRMIIQYVKANKLYDEADKRALRPDDKLSQVLLTGSANGDAKPVTYFNLQSLIKHHFIKPAAATVGGTAAAAAVAVVSA